MKKLTLFFTFAIFFMVLNVVKAGSLYPDYLGGNKDLILCGGHMGMGGYLDRSSIVIQKDEPNVKQIAVNVAYVDDAHKDNTNIRSVLTEYYLYQLDSGKVYRYAEHNDSWTYIKPVGSLAETGHYFAYEMAYYIVFHEKFYGGKTYWSSSEQKNLKPHFGDELYAIVDGAY